MTNKQEMQNLLDRLECDLMTIAEAAAQLKLSKTRTRNILKERNALLEFLGRPLVETDVVNAIELEIIKRNS